MATLITDDVYDDGSEYFAWDDGSFERYSPDGYLVESYYPLAPAVQPPGQEPSWLATLVDGVVGVFGGGQRGYYPPNRTGFPLQTRGTVPFGVPGGTTPNYCNGIQLGGGVGSSSAGICISKTMLLLGGAGLALFLFGQRRGRR